MAKVTKLSVVQTTGNIELREITGKVTRFTVNDSTHAIEDGWHATTRLSFQIPVKASQFQGFGEYDIIAALESVGHRQSEGGGKTATNCRIKRAMPVTEIKLEGDKGVDLVFMADFKTVVFKAVKGELTLCLTVDADLMAASLPTLAAFRGSDIKITTTTAQGELALDKSAAA